MRALLLAWPGIALAITFVDDFVAGPVLGVTGAWLGGHQGILLGVVVFTALVAALVTSAVLAGRSMDAKDRARIDTAVAAASRRRFVGRFVRRVGDDHPWSTAVVATVVSPVLAVLLAQLVHPGQRLVITTATAVLSYGVMFALFYSGLGAAAGDLVS